MKILQRLEELRVLSTVADAGLLSKAEVRAALACCHEAWHGVRRGSVYGGSRPLLNLAYAWPAPDIHLACAWPAPSLRLAWRECPTGRCGARSGNLCGCHRGALPFSCHLSFRPHPACPVLGPVPALSASAPYTLRCRRVVSSPSWRRRRLSARSRSCCPSVRCATRGNLCSLSLQPAACNYDLVFVLHL